MKKSLTRRRFLQAAALTTTATVFHHGTGEAAWPGNASGDHLLRYVLSLPVAVANVGMDGFAPLESCVEVGREPVISQKQAKIIEKKLNFDPNITRLPYFTG